MTARRNNNMIEKFSETLGKKFLDQVGEFVFEITEHELKDGPKGVMAVLEAKSEAGTTTLYHSLNAKAKWSYANLVKACFELDTKAKVEAFAPHDGGIDYELIGNDLIGKKFLGVVERQQYRKEVKIPKDDGTFENGVETKDSYKIVEYKTASGK